MTPAETDELAAALADASGDAPAAAKKGGGDAEADAMAAEWEAMLGGAEEGADDLMGGGGGRESTRVLNQDEIDSLLGFDEAGDEGRGRRVIDLLESQALTAGEAGIFNPIRHALLDGGDHYYHLADFGSYLRAQQRVSEDYLNRSSWAEKALINISGMGYFSSDRAIAEYARETWNIQSCRD